MQWNEVCRRAGKVEGCFGVMWNPSPAPEVNRNISMALGDAGACCSGIPFGPSFMSLMRPDLFSSPSSSGCWFSYGRSTRNYRQGRGGEEEASLMFRYLCLLSSGSRSLFTRHVVRSDYISSQCNFYHLSLASRCVCSYSRFLASWKFGKFMRLYKFINTHNLIATGSVPNDLLLIKFYEFEIKFYNNIFLQIIEVFQ